ncbi:hypothetical protein B0H63DRAFT_303394 [Podospora didyma]|uniref:DNA-directed RNA polymerase subunit n=1 Tax=Podospora didyma TaxID=330526 RepID=A0AAE0K5Q5_9PEZI|nr:hypothetical protein B0H63DRAFT_303394 [Podospora didyma]
MSATDADDALHAVIPSSLTEKSPKKNKRDKKEHKKRPRDDDELAVVAETPLRKQKRAKNENPTNEDANSEPEQPDLSERRKKKKQHKHRGDSDDELEADEAAEAKAARKKSKKRRKHRDEDQKDGMDFDAPEDEEAHSKRKSKDRKKDKKKRHFSPPPTADADDRMEVDAPTAASTTLPIDPSFPFFTQAISLYLPFFPVGFDKPLTNIAAQHLDPLLNHYSPVLRGVLLSYSNLNLSDRPTKASRLHPPTDETPALLHSFNEYAVGFGWLTFDAHLFVPARGKWMEGVLQLQSEGYIGVVCWNKFNASVEAKRLPKGWRWIDLEKSNGDLPTPDWDNEPVQEERSSEDALDGEELQVVEQMHTTGYWVNESGRKVSGKLRFRIKNFDVGLAGDYGYLSLEGTFLDDDAERALVAEEREQDKKRRSRQNPTGGLRPLSRRVPEFSMTKFGKEEEEEDSGQRTIVYKGSRPGTPDD